MSEGWTSFFEQEIRKPYYQKLMEFVSHEYGSKTIYPKQNDLFRCFELTPYEHVKVVILGQDPYHGAGQANGLCFSVNKGVGLPPSLKNIYRELQDDLHCSLPSHGDLSCWAKQGVLLLNTVLTVEKGKANSHKGKGWETFTDHVLSYLNQRGQPMVFFLWGIHAQRKRRLITSDQHLIIASSHPSPLSAYHDFFGSRPFSQANEFLIRNGAKPVNWQIEEE